MASLEQVFSRLRKVSRACLPAAERVSPEILRLVTKLRTWLWCINDVGDGFRPLCRFLGDLPGDRHAEAGHAVDHLAGDVGFDLLRGQSPGPEAPADQNLVPVESC